MFISLDQIKISLSRLEEFNPFFGMSFLAFKKARLPIGSTVKINFTQIATDILERHYRPSSTYQGYYNPFFTSDRYNRWTAIRYPSTSLQRITKDTFDDTLLHPSKTTWGWRQNYEALLAAHLPNRKLPAYDLAVWLFREENWPSSTQPSDVVDRLFFEYDITSDERKYLFDVEAVSLAHDWLSSQAHFEGELFDIIGHPPGSLPEAGAALERLVLKSIGPAQIFEYEPAPRLNVITGDNSLGKTFLLEAIWWALTGSWVQNQLAPRSDVAKNTPTIEFTLSPEKGRPQDYQAKYDWTLRAWRNPERRVTAGLVIYARNDGSFAVWDPSRLAASENNQSLPIPDKLVFAQNDIWYGLTAPNSREPLCNGLLRDWVAWQTSGIRYQDRWQIFVSALKTLAPLGEGMEPVEPRRLDFSDLEMPILRLPYGEVPIMQTSAGVQRTVALAYILVWSWFRHLENSAIIRVEPQKRLVLLIDEIEAHLHPRWQRVIVPSLMAVIGKIAPSIAPQMHLATHSPLIMASLETEFDEDIDDLHNLKLEQSGVFLRELEFIKRGRVDLWLMSELFGLGHARSVPAEEAIEAAKKVQLERNPDPSNVKEINQKLLESLAQDDDFWPRWRYFAKKYGIE